ncbi:MAG TPA: hypothetical protein VK399_11035 [Longimicrobiaceae bacterium]|nr:hypothetical protein [Longimicrobiaceae bacterium]
MNLEGRWLWLVLIFVPSDELDAAGRSGLYHCNAILARYAVDVVSVLLSEPETLAGLLPAIGEIKYGLKDFRHLQFLLDQGAAPPEARADALARLESALLREPVYFATHLDDDSISTAEQLAFYVWIYRAVPVSTFETKPRRPWELSFLPLESEYRNYVLGTIGGNRPGRPPQHGNTSLSPPVYGARPGNGVSLCGCLKSVVEALRGTETTKKEAGERRQATHDRVRRQQRSGVGPGGQPRHAAATETMQAELPSSCEPAAGGKSGAHSPLLDGDPGRGDSTGDTR